MPKISDYEFAEISRQNYKDHSNYILVNIKKQEIKWEISETIKSPDTGLDGYVLQNPDTNAIVISFRGTESSKDIEEDIRELFLVIPIIPKKNMEKHLI
jgi:hypothetical protein